MSWQKQKIKIEHGPDDVDEVKSTIHSDPYSGSRASQREPVKQVPKERVSEASKQSTISPSTIAYDESAQKLIVPKISFTKGTSELSGKSEDNLKAVAQFLSSKTELKIKIEVYTDSLGSDKSNLDLTSKRAEVVQQKLVSLGVEASRLQAEGKGDTVLLATDETAEGREKNRRVEFLVSAAPQAASVPPASAPTDAVNTPVPPPPPPAPPANPLPPPLISETIPTLAQPLPSPTPPAQALPPPPPVSEGTLPPPPPAAPPMTPPEVPPPPMSNPPTQ